MACVCVNVSKYIQICQSLYRTFQFDAAAELSSATFQPGDMFWSRCSSVRSTRSSKGLFNATSDQDKQRQTQRQTLTVETKASKYINHQHAIAQSTLPLVGSNNVIQISCCLLSSIRRCWKSKTRHAKARMIRMDNAWQCKVGMCW